ncbi:MAG: GNAT family N-acetyltransferase [Nitrososphaerota archaeon]|nr:GNAT family N-acetyltransferase [Nitrososphaerota archaeon]MDG6972751.1 GNAT family N-acetyltransferase [Nitrososphaerota archaeon]MDG6974020.1 GNAT family N-acetyltransferase [Nitrososphaerota archaeon]MDG7026736.1 GNAT family N-acetyltransferase [Nitrososphaerota archaeon]
MVNTRVAHSELRKLSLEKATREHRRLHHSEKPMEDPNDVVALSFEYAQGRGIERQGATWSERKRAKVKIRPFAEGDMKSVLRLAQRYGSFDNGVTESAFTLRSTFPQGFLVAEKGAALVGFVYSHLRDVPKETLDRWKAGSVGYIAELAVSPSYRRIGIGGWLMQDVLSAMKESGVELVLLDCPAEAKEATALYRKLGFSVRAQSMWKRL